MFRTAPIALFAASLAASVAAQTTETNEFASSSVRQTPAEFAQFAPGKRPIDHSIDYSIWDYALKNLVISMGPSMRKSAGRPDPVIGTRRQVGHNSIYRLEGSLIGFYFLNGKVKRSFGEYRRDLEATADLVDIQSLPRNEQLAYWFNLHNVALIEKIAEEWPLRQPRNYEIDGVLLDELKFMTVKGVPLSLRDIRENIVYLHWRDPKVIYGFWRGEIGGPAMQREAFNANNVDGLLDRAAREFVNSLRGTQKRGKTLHVSTLYQEVAPFFFANPESDIREHLADFANEEVTKFLDKTSQLEPSVREYDIADLSGGNRNPITINNGASIRVPPGVARLLAQRQRKFEIMIREGVRTGTVTFSNIDLPGDEENKGEVE